MKKRLIVLAALASLLLASCGKPQTAWITDMDAAKSASAKSKKDLLVVFTGSDWNDPSKELIKNVFTDEFFKKGSKNFVLCNIDIVQDDTKMDAAVLEANYNTATKFGVQALPYFLLMTPEGDLYGTSASNDKTGTIDGLFTYLGTFKDARKNLLDLKKKVKASKGTERAANIDKFVEAVAPSQREQYADLMREIPTLDADGKAGLKGKYQLQIAYLDAIKLYQDGKMTEAGDCFIKLTEGTTLNAAQTQEAWYMGAYMYAMSGTMENAKVIEWLEKAIAADPKNTGTPQIQATIDQLKSAPEGSSIKQ